jgi:hypothetical protein
MAKEGQTAALTLLLESLKDEPAARRMLCCIGAARGLIEKERPQETIDWENP